MGRNQAQETGELFNLAPDVRQQLNGQTSHGLTRELNRLLAQERGASVVSSQVWEVVFLRLLLAHHTDRTSRVRVRRSEVGGSTSSASTELDNTVDAVKAMLRQNQRLSKADLLHVDAIAYKIRQDYPAQRS